MTAYKFVFPNYNNIAYLYMEEMIKQDNMLFSFVFINFILLTGSYRKPSVLISCDQ